MNTKEFIDKARKVHGDKYDYSKVEYKGNKEEVCIICPEHGEFWQLPSSHLRGQGCRECNDSHLEIEIKDFLKDKIKFLHNTRPKWLEKKSLDFYLPEYNAAIECQGAQHFKAMKFFDKHDSYENRLKRDVLKKQLCEENGVKLYYFSHEPFDEFLNEKVYHNKEELIDEIIKSNQKEFI